MSNTLRMSLTKFKECLRRSSRSQIVGGGGSLFAVFGIFNSTDPEFDVCYDPDKVTAAYSDRQSLNWKERLSLMWRKDEYEHFSPEIDECFEVVSASAVFGFMLGGYRRSRTAFDHFVAANKHEMFRHPREAQLAVWDRVLLAMMKGGFSVGWRSALVSGLFCVSVTTSNVVRNYVQPLDHAAIGFGVGALYRTLMGPRAMLGAGAVGATLGLTEGCLTWAMLKLSGETVEQRWNRKFRYLENKNSQVLKENREVQAKLIPRGDWVANEDDNSPSPEQEDERDTSLTAFAKSILLKSKNLILSMVENK